MKLEKLLTEAKTLESVFKPLMDHKLIPKVTKEVIAKFISEMKNFKVVKNVDSSGITEDSFSYLDAVFGNGILDFSVKVRAFEQSNETIDACLVQIAILIDKKYVYFAQNDDGKMFNTRPNAEYRNLFNNRKIEFITTQNYERSYEKMKNAADLINKTVDAYFEWFLELTGKYGKDLKLIQSSHDVLTNTRDDNRYWTPFLGSLSLSFENAEVKKIKEIVV